MAFRQSSGSTGKTRGLVALKQSTLGTYGEGFGWGVVRLEWERVVLKLRLRLDWERIGR